MNMKQDELYATSKGTCTTPLSFQPRPVSVRSARRCSAQGAGSGSKEEGIGRVVMGRSEVVARWCGQRKHMGAELECKGACGETQTYPQQLKEQKTHKDWAGRAGPRGKG